MNETGMGISIGDVLPIRTLRVVIQDGQGWMDFKSAKGECFVVMLLGKESVAAGGPKLDPVEVLNALGWEAVTPPSARHP